MGNGVPKGAQSVHCEAVPGGGSNILWTPATMSGGHGGLADLTEIGQEGATTEGDNMRRVRREFGEGDSAGRWLDVPPRWHKPSTTLNLPAVRHDQRP